LGDRLLKVNHAGENGAVAIYSAQIWLARWTAPSLVQDLHQFRADEQGHRALFGHALQQRNLRRCRSYWLCWLGGWVLGCITGLAGARAIHATTVAVEKVVLQHLEQQLAALAGEDENAASIIAQIVTEEQLHHDHSATHSRDSGWDRIIHPIVSRATKSVIWLGMHL